MKYVALIILVSIIVLWYYSISGRYQFMDGFWEASSDFADEAGVDSIMIYFDQPTGWLSNKRQGYILIADDVTNQSFTLTYSRAWSLSPFSYTLRGIITFDDHQIWDKDISIDVDINKNKMIIRHDKTVYAVVHKSID